MILRDATAEDVPALVALLRDDGLGAGRETAAPDAYADAFAALPPQTTVVVGEEGGAVVATYQITILHGLSRGGARRALVEAVRVASGHRSRGLGAALMADAEARARAAGCALVQLTSDASRADAHRFYARLGYEPSHVGFKRMLEA